MKDFRADLHIHTVLSPCADVEMSPSNIVRVALEKELDIIGVADHNSTRQSKLVRDIGQRHGLMVLTGAEVTTREEIHCLAFFGNDEQLDRFQDFIDRHLPDIPNNPDLFGYQLLVDEHEQVIEEIDTWLISGLNASITQVNKVVHELGGMFIPSHIDRGRFSLLSQLGIFPDDLEVDAVELSARANHEDLIWKHPGLAGIPAIRSSDAHYLENIGERTTLFTMQEKSFDEIRWAFMNKEKREIKLK